MMPACAYDPYTKVTGEHSRRNFREGKHHDRNFLRQRTRAALDSVAPKSSTAT